MKVLAFGEVLWDIYETEKYIGGAPLNFSAHFKKCGGEAWILTAVGDDEIGRETIREIENLNVNTDFVSIVEQETGKCIVSLDENQIPSYDLLNNVAYDYVKMPCFENGFFDVLYFGTLALRKENNLSVLKGIMEKGTFKDVFVDINLRKPYNCKNVIEFACQNATIIKISDEELQEVMVAVTEGGGQVKECAYRLSCQFQNLNMIIITKGENGSLVYDCVSKRYYECEARRVQVVSTVGAGDSFSAGFLTKYMQEDDIQKALDFAARLSAYVVSCIEAIPDYEIEAFE